jgi:hypothetical protein
MGEAMENTGGEQNVLAGSPVPWIGSESGIDERTAEACQWLGVLTALEIVCLVPKRHALSAWSAGNQSGRMDRATLLHGPRPAEAGELCKRCTQFRGGL